MNEVIVRYFDNGYGNVSGEIVGDLVRCKECRHWWETAGANYGDCNHFHLDTLADDFCSYGEREGE